MPGSQQEEDPTMERPVALTPEALKAASAGRSEEVLGPGKPIHLTMDEVKHAASGKSEEVMRKKAEKSP
jgi:hypothetical protein